MTSQTVVGLVDELNDRLVELDRRSMVTQLSAGDGALLEDAHRALEGLATAYVEANEADRRLIRERAGIHPQLRMSWRDRVRRRLTWFPKRHGDYRAALNVVVLTYAEDARRRIRDPDGLRRLRLALAALAIEGGRQDDRDTRVALTSLHEAALRANVDVKSIIEGARLGSVP